MNKTMSGSFADGRTADDSLAFVPMGELRFESVCACERGRDRSGKWKAPLEGPLESTLYTRRWNTGVRDLGSQVKPNERNSLRTAVPH